MPKEYMSPDGAKIIGTKEIIPGVAAISGINDDGTPCYDGGGGTDIHWDGQQTVKSSENDQIIFVDDDGQEWTFDQLLPVPDEDAGEDE